MTVKIPTKINVAILLKSQNLSKTRFKSMRDKIYYFLSLLTRTNDNTEFLLESDGFKKICSKIQKKIHGNSDYYLVLKILESGDTPIIEKNMKWKNSNEDTDGYCQGFRISKVFDTGSTKTVRINKALSSKIIENSKSEIDKAYRFLTDQFKKHRITLDPLVYDYLIDYYKKIKTLTKENKYQNIVLKNHIGKWLDYIDRINKNDLWCRVCKDNYRLNSTLTSIPKEIRRFILINEKPLEMIDIKSSQPYILSSIIKTRFFLDKEKGYNISTIHNKIYKKIKSIIIKTNKNYKNNTIVSNKSPYKQSITRTSLYMWCEFLTKKEAQSLIEYGLYEFKNDFYTDIINKNISNFQDESIQNRIELREKLKSVMMLILFDDNFKNRNNNVYIKLFKNIYPGICAWIERLHRIIGKREFSYLMQRTESYLMLNNVCREFNQRNIDAPIFTIHDALYTTKEYIQELTDITNDVLFDITGKIPGIKHSCEIITSCPEKNVIEARWKKIKVINSKKRFEKISNSILENNLLLAEEFLKMHKIDK
jgi:hypothetical protein